MSKDAIAAIKLRCNVTCDLLQYDGFFARLSLPQKDVTPTTITETQQFIKHANILVHQLQMSVTAEGHVALVHACKQMDIMGGVSHGREDRVEVWHQFGKAADVLTRNRRKSEQRFLQISRWEQMNRNPLIAKHKETIKGEFALSESTLLKRKANWDNNSRSKKRQTHDEREAVRATSLREFKSPAQTFEIEVLRQCETDGNKYVRGLVIPCSADLRQMAAKVEQLGDELCPYKISTTDDGEMVAFDLPRTFLLIVEAHGLTEIAKTHPI